MARDQKPPHLSSAMKSHWYIQNCSLFRRLSTVQLSQLESSAKVKVFPKNSPIYLPSDVTDAAFLVGKGRVRVCFNTSQGKQAILAFIEAGELFGELSVIDPSEREDRAEAVVESTILLLPGGILRQIMEQSTDLAVGITKLIGFRRKKIERRLRNLLFRSGRDRLGYLLLELAEQYGRWHPQGVELGIRLSHQELASLVGITREFASSTLGEMQAEGFLLLSRQRLVISKLTALARSLGVAPPVIPVVTEAALTKPVFPKETTNDPK